MLQCNLGRLVGFAKVQTAQKEQLKKKKYCFDSRNSLCIKTL